MAQLSATRTILTSVLRARIAPAVHQTRQFATDKDDKINLNAISQTADPAVYGYCGDELEAPHIEGQQYRSRLVGDDRYEHKIYFRAQKSSKEYPNLVPSPDKVRAVGCFCDKETVYPVYGTFHKGIPKRCRCGHWFLVVDNDPDSTDI